MTNSSGSTCSNYLQSNTCFCHYYTFSYWDCVWVSKWWNSPTVEHPGCTHGWVTGDLVVHPHTWQLFASPPWWRSGLHWQEVECQWCVVMTRSLGGEQSTDANITTFSVSETLESTHSQYVPFTHIRVDLHVPTINNHEYQFCVWCYFFN